MIALLIEERLKAIGYDFSQPEEEAEAGSNKTKRIR
jgi:hypothetical protein